MPGGKAHGIDRDYQVLARDILQRRARPMVLVPYLGDGIDIPILLGSAVRTFDVALKDSSGQVVVAECKRTRGPVKLGELDTFAHRVELLRKQLGVPVAGVYFAKTAYQLGAIKSAPDSGVQVAVCAQDQPINAFSLAFKKYDPQHDRVKTEGEVSISRTVKSSATLGRVLIRRDGNREDK